MAFDTKYDPKRDEPRWQAFWEEQGVFRFDPSDTRPIFSVDTPPPTVSGSMHVGHVFSYTQAEAMIRFWRQRGMNVFYPFGFDDNGLPTERFVEEKRKIRGRDLPRAEFVKQCLEVTREVEAQFKRLWMSLGFSCDWTQEYSTIGESSQRISQRSFLELLEKGLIERREAPALWCPECQTAVAQAEEEDVESETLFSRIPFAIDGGGEILIATTRPELLSSCVCVFIHPDDDTHRHLVGKTARTPLFDRPVPILTNPDIDREKGTGIVMCCTFGDTKDIAWWHDYELPLRESIDRRGRMTDLAGPYAGQKVAEARKAILEELESRGLVRAQERVRHVVNTHERCGTPIEFLATKQWFLRVLDFKRELIDAGSQIRWFPKLMKVRYDHWVENLHWDWSISRQRFYGVPIPVWHCDSCGSFVLPKDEELPVDPQATRPSTACGCGSTSVTPETDVLDTWATSSVTPEINARWKEATGDRSARLLPMSMRPQAHDIIRTWAFYTIVKAHHHHGRIPWRDIVISGHVVDGERKKISKSKLSGGKGTALQQVFAHPDRLIERFSADPVRYWTCRSTLGTDTAYDEQMIEQGRRLVTKLWNAARFTLQNLEDYDGSAGTPTLIDRGVRSQLGAMQRRVTAALEEYEMGNALRDIESYFWSTFCDNYLEMVKARLYDPTTHGVEGRRAAQATLLLVLGDLVKLLAPFIPHVTEGIYQEGLRRAGDPRSVHVTTWPDGGAACDPEGEAAFADVLDVLTAVRKFKSESSLSMGASLTRLTIAAEGDRHSRLKRSIAEIASTARAQEIVFGRAEGGPTETSEGGVPLWIEPAPVQPKT
jgi:valyl-tRNA synthetase